MKSEIGASLRRERLEKGNIKGRHCLKRRQISGRGAVKGKKGEPKDMR